jgi:tetratricopeptide (TPR) repeat protein
MSTAIIIIILILILSVGLFFLIKKLSNVSDIEHEIYEEGAITDFSTISQEVDEIVDDKGNYKTKSTLKVALLMSNLHSFFNNQIQKIKQIHLHYRQRQIDKIKAKEKEIQESIQRDLEVQELEAQDQKENNIIDEIDTSSFEAESTMNSVVKEQEVDSKIQEKNEEIITETKATDFVEQLLSEVDAIADVNSDDISDTYYYEYMEKRYIDKIVANSKDIEAYKKLGDLYVDMRNYKDALEAFQYVLKLKPNDTLSSRRVKDISNRLQKQN